ncbi:hypothetical protein JCM17380_03560 [Desulfosporosinus burensis]
MDVHRDLVSSLIDPQHGIGETVSSHCLDNIFYEPTPIGAHAAPLFILTDAFIGDGLATEFIKLHIRLDVGEPST